MAYICPKLKITHLSVNSRMNKQIVFCTYNEILYSKNTGKSDRF